MNKGARKAIVSSGLAALISLEGCASIGHWKNNSDEKAAGMGLVFAGNASRNPALGGAAVWAGSAMYNSASQKENRPSVTIYNSASSTQSRPTSEADDPESFYNNVKRDVSIDPHCENSEFFIKFVRERIEVDHAYWTPRVLKEPEVWRPLFPESYDAMVARHKAKENASR